MFNWIKRLFCGDDLPKDHNGLPLVTCDIPMPKVKPLKPEKDISEPVLAIVECMKKYPSRFKIKETSVEGEIPIRTFTDLKTNQELVVKRCISSWNNGWYAVWSWSWLTEDEKSILEITFSDIYRKKISRLHAMQRAKMKGLYK